MRARLRPDVLWAALALIVIQLAFRAWVVSGSWWLGDDFVMIDRVFSPGGSTLSALLADYSGHVLPGTLGLTYLITRAAPYEFWVAAVAMVAMQAFANLGLLRLLVVAFGRRWGILPPLVAYLVSPIVVQSTLWWTPGSHHFLLHGAFAWAMASQISYLRSGRATSAVAAVAWVVLGLVFFEKTLLVIGALAFVTLAYFTTGGLTDRVRETWRRYRLSFLLNLGVGAGFLAVYAASALPLTPTDRTASPALGELVDGMLMRSWLPALIGGPLRWSAVDNAPTPAADPPAALIVAALVAFGLLVRELARTRTRSLRALALPAFFLLCNLVLVGVARATLLGSAISPALRYISELSVISAAALGFATMPVLGAREPVEVKAPSRFFDNGRAVAAACTVVAALATVSSLEYAHQWSSGRAQGARWAGNLLAEARAAEPGTPVMDSPAPAYVMWPLAYPANLASHLVRPLNSGLDFVPVGSETLQAVGPDGHLAPASLTSLTRNQPGPERPCGYRVGPTGAKVELFGTAPGETWVRIGYLASADSTIHVSAGGATYQTSVSQGLHYLFFQAGQEEVDAVWIYGIVAPATLCTDDVVVGLPGLPEDQ